MSIAASVFLPRTFRCLAAAALPVVGTAPVLAKTAIILNSDDDSLSVIDGDTYK